jgi:hypothetical protein
MRKLLAALGFLSVIGTSSAGDYAEGQVWTYHTRSGDEGSTFQINKIETDPKLGRIFHISVFGVHLNNPHVAGGITTDLPHFPVSKETLDKSVISLAGMPTRKVAYEEGYAEWKKAFDAGRAGIFTISVAEIVSTIEQTIASHGP